MLDKNVEVFVIYSASLISKMTMHLAQKAQIALLLAKNVTVLAEYTDFANIFSEKSATVLPEWIGINKHAIELPKGK